MKRGEIVIYWHRFGVVVYKIDNSVVVNLGKADDPEGTQVKELLTKYSGSNARILLADSVSYLLTTNVTAVVGKDFRSLVRESLRSSIPDDIPENSWDYKVAKTEGDISEVIVFSPVKEFRLQIFNLCQELGINIVAIEPESIAESRNPNPVLGISQKQDISGKDDSTLNISVASNPSPKFKPSHLFLFIAIISLISSVVIWQMNTNKKSPVVPPISPSPTAVSTTIPTPTTISTIKSIDQLQIEVLNGTTKSGFAKTIADNLIASGFVNITTGNAAPNNYLISKLIFVSEEIKTSYLKLITDIRPVTSDNISVDNTITKDVKFILGTN